MATSSPSYGKTVWNAQEYDAPRRRLVSSFNLIYDTTADQVALAAGDQLCPAVLDLGAGTGLLSAAVARRIPGAQLHLLDGSPDMLNQARQRLANQPGTQFTIGDLTAPLPAGPFTAIVSGLAIHHLTGEQKRDLYCRSFVALQPGGMFINLDQVLGPTARIETEYQKAHERYARNHGSDDAEWAAAEERMRIDRPDTLTDQLQWLVEIGFIDVDCVVKDYRLAVFRGRRPG